jgi:hypothetical protein
VTRTQEFAASGVNVPDPLVYLTTLSGLPEDAPGVGNTPLITMMIYPTRYQLLVACTNLIRKKSSAASVVGSPYRADAPFALSVNAVICCVVVINTSVPSEVLVFSGNVTAPVAKVVAG